MMGEVFCGHVSSIEGESVRVVPDSAPGSVSLPLNANWTVGELSIDDEVICVRLPDGCGLVLAKKDGSR